MSASSSSTQLPVETKEGVKDVKPTKPPIKPKPFVPPKPKQAFISTNSENKGPPLSPGPCSPTTDIPSAFKISQLTGPQPYGARRTSLRRWSSSVGEEVPLESNTLLSPVENVMPELYNKVTTQPLAAAAKHLQTGSVWKGKSPFMLTTRGWGEQKSQGKDIHESGSVPQKPTVNSDSKDVDLMETVPEGDTVVNSSSLSRSILSTDHKEVQTNVQDLKPKILSKAPEEVKKTPLEDSSSGKSKIIKISASDNEPKKSQESSKFSDSPQTDAYFGMTKQSTQCEPNKPDTKTVDLSDQSGLVTTGGTQDHDKASVQWKNSPKDIEGSQLTPPVPKPRPRSNILVKESTKTIEGSPSSDPSNLTAHEVYRHHEDIPELKPEIREEKDAHSVYLQTSPSQIRVVSQNRDQEILPKLETGEKPEISSMTQITDEPLTKSEDKKGTVSTEHKLLYTAENYHEGKAKVPSDNHNKPSHEDKKIVAPTDLTPPSCTVKANEIYSKGQETTCTQVHDYNIEKDQPKNRQHEYDDTVRDESKNIQHEYDDTVRDESKNRHEYDDAIRDPSKNRQHEYADAVRDESKNRQYEYDDAIRDESKDTQQEDVETIWDQSKNSQHEYDDTIQDPSKSSQHEEHDTKWNPSKNRQHKYDDTIQTGEYVPYQTSEVSEKHTEHPSEYRFFENNEDLPYYSKIPSAPELPGPTDAEAISNLCVGSQIVKNANLISGDLFSHSADESHSMDKGDQPRKPHDDLDLLQRHGSSRPELSYDESHFRYSEVVGMSQQDKLSDYNEQSDLLDYYTSQSPILNEREVHPKKIEFGADELHMPQHGQSQPQTQEFTDAHKVELDYKKSDEQVHKYDQSEESDYKYQELKKSVHKYEQLDKSTVKYEQLEESDQRSGPSEEPEYIYEQSQEPMSRHQQPWGSDLKDEETDKSAVKYESGKRSEPSKESEEFDQRSEPSMEPEESDQRYVPSKEPEESDQRSEPSMEPEESDHRSEPSKEPEYTYEQSQESLSRYQQPWGSELKNEETEKSTVKCEKSEESHNRSEPSEEPEYTYEQSQDPMSRYQQPWGSDLKDGKSAVKSEQLEESDQRSEPSKEPEFTYEQSQEEINRWGSDHKYNQTEESGHRHEKLEHSMGQYELLEQPSYGHEKSEEEVNKNDRSEEFVHVTSPPAPNISSNKYSSPEESEHRYAYFEEKVHTMEELKYPVTKFEQLDEPSEYEQSTKPIQGYQISEKPVYRFKESEEIIHDQSQETDYRYVQHYESAHFDELVSQRERTEDLAYVHTGSDAKNSQVESLQRPSESNLRNSQNEKPTCVDSLTEEIHDSKKTSEEQVLIHTLPGGQQLQGVHEEETRHAESEGDQHVDDLTEGSKEELPAIKTDDSKLEEIQDQEAKTYPVLNGHAEDSVDSTSDAVKEIHTEEPEETQAEKPNVENFDFLEGTVVLDSSFMRGKASLGKKRGHRIPVGTCDAEEKDPEYWMFRDSTEPKIISEKQSDKDEKERQVDEDEKDEASPNSSQSPVKSPHKKGIFAGIISPSLLKGRLKNRSKTMDDEMVRPEAEESKSPGKEKPESPSHSLNWLQALKKKKKSSKETTKEEKKKQPK